MGIACGDLDGDGRPDLAVTDFYNESTTLYRNLGAGVFTDHTARSGLPVPTRYLLGFGVAFLDVNDDGRLDLATANGHVDDFRPAEPYGMPAQLLVGTPAAGSPTSRPRRGLPGASSGSAAAWPSGDLDNDGRLDLVILSQNEPLAYFHNRTEGGHWLMLGLEARLEPRRRRRAGDRHGRRASPDRLADRRRELPVGVRSEAPLRPGRADAPRTSRSPGRRAGSSITGTSRPMPATGCARGAVRPGRGRVPALRSERLAGQGGGSALRSAARAPSARRTPPRGSRRSAGRSAAGPRPRPGARWSVRRETRRAAMIS